MPRIVTALFKDRAAAQSALSALLGMGMARDRIAILEGGHGQVSSISGFRELSARDDGDAGLQDLGLPEEDVAELGEGLRRGGALLSARIESRDLEEVVSTLEMFDMLDLDSATQAGRARGPDRGPGAPLGAGITGGASAGSTNTAALPGMGQMADHTSDVGSADLRTGEAGLSDQGRSTLPASGDRRAEERAGAPGVAELAGRRETGAGVAGFRREPRQGSRVRVFVTGP